MSDSQAQPSTDDLLVRIAQLERRLDEQEAELRAVRSDAVSPAPAGVTGTSGSPSGRRYFMRAAAAAATGALVGGAARLGDASPVAAVNGDPLIIGSSLNTGTEATGLAVTGTDAAYGIGVTDNGLNTISGFPAVFGHAQRMNFFVGVLGLATAAANAVEGRATNGIGVLASSTQGLGIFSTSTQNVGARFSGGKAALLLGDQNAPPPTRAEIHDRGEIDLDTSGDLWLCVQDGTPGTWRKLAGPSTAGAFHVLPSTIRVYDSRDGLAPLGVIKGPLGTDEERVVDVKLDAAVPAGATAVFINLTIVSASTLGFLSAFKNGITWPGNSTINWERLGQVAANSAVVALDDAAQFRMHASNPVHYIVDVIGYYR